MPALVGEPRAQPLGDPVEFRAYGVAQTFLLAGSFMRRDCEEGLLLTK
jgi:hypothetical protein